MVQRLNTGGSSILPVEDFGLFRRWDADSNYLFKSFVRPSNNHAFKNMPTSMQPYIAPLRLYHTSWNAGTQKSGIDEMHNFTWKIPVDPGFAYLIRLHFCELGSRGAETGLLEFNVLINNQIAERKADIIRWGGGHGIPVFRDYMVLMKGKKEGGKSDLFISLQFTNVLVVSLINGLEVFKLSDLEDSLASPNPVCTKLASVSWTLNTRDVLLAFTRGHGNATIMILLITFVNVIVYSMRQILERELQWEKHTGSASTESSCHCFSLAEIRSATDDFSEAYVIGKGGFGKVYKGLVRGIPETLAIKRLNLFSKQGPREFWSEIETLSKLRHIHLVSLIGYCNESQEMILVYKYMPCGILADNLYKIRKKNKVHVPLSWEQRLRICIGAARGLDYLHTGTKYGVIHRDVKDSNILLDENFEAKISDFGLSKLETISQSESLVSTKVKGTLGYLDPDYLATHKPTRKSDVYAFGVVLLVVLSGRPALDIAMLGESQSLLSCFRNCIGKGDIEEIVDPKLQGEISSESLKMYVKSIEKCVEQQPKRRPTMAQVVVSLEDALEQQRCALSSASEGGNVVGQLHKAETSNRVRFNEDSVLPKHESGKSFPQEGILSQPVLNGAFPSKRKNMKSGQKDSVRKPLWGWPWETLWSRGKPMKKKNMAPSNEPYSRFSITDIQAATNNFSDDLIIFGDKHKVVYRGQGEQPLMISRFEIELDNIEILEFSNELDMLSFLSHPCLLPLKGHVFHENKVFVIYEYRQNSTLHSYLYDPERTPLSWKQRLQVCIAVARGLDYLHQGTNLRIIHRDMKPDSILLDKHLLPKITNFGLSKVGPTAQFASTRMNSSCSEYLSPDVLVPVLPLTEKSDVYSFGLVLLEILCCHRRIHFDLNVDLAGRFLHHWVKRGLKDRTLHDIIDPHITGEIAVVSLTEFLRVAFSCLLLQATERPSAEIVADRLMAALRLQERAETAKQDIKGKGGRGFDLEDTHMILGIATADGFEQYTPLSHEYTGMSEEILESVDLDDRMT